MQETMSFQLMLNSRDRVVARPVVVTSLIFDFQDSEKLQNS
jgi:hypothetical protein